MREICRGLAFPEGPIAMSDGSVLLGELQRGTLSRVTPHGRIEVIAQCGGGPNGAALGPDGRVYICNNGGLTWRVIDGFVRAVGAADQALIGSIQAVNLRTGAVETLYDACQGEPLKARTISSLMHTGGFILRTSGSVAPAGWTGAPSTTRDRWPPPSRKCRTPWTPQSGIAQFLAVCSGPKTQS